MNATMFALIATNKMFSLNFNKIRKDAILPPHQIDLTHSSTKMQNGYKASFVLKHTTKDGYSNGRVLFMTG